ncbi:MAG: D-alanyl-D-alanine carboxypeptidase/D-alanyl-D-alanine-endopeptidase [Planctomycetota bacterium]
MPTAKSHSGGRPAILLLLLLPPLLASCFTPGAGASELVARALEMARTRGIDPESIAFAIRTPGGVLHAHRSRVPMAPASNLKLLAAAAALDHLGGDFLLRTDLLRHGAIEDGVLDGDLIVVGRGDPSISGRLRGGDPLAELRPWAALLKELGVRRVRGALLADDRYLGGPSALPEWPAEQLHRWYAAPSGALNLNDNCVDVVIAPDAGGSSIAVSILPEIPLFELRGRIEPVATEAKHRYSIDRSPGSWEIRVAGGFLRSGAERRHPVTVPDPSRAFLAALETLLAAEGIVVEGGSRVAAAPAGSVLVDRIAHPLAALLPILLKRSQNLYGDSLLRVLGKERGGDGSFASGARVLEDFLRESIGDADGAAIRDGSGLSSKNRLSAAQLLGILEEAQRRPWGSLLLESLPVAARDGTLRKRFRDSPLAGRLRAKTGHVSGVTNLTGLISTPRGPVLFSVLHQGTAGTVPEAEKWQREVLEMVLSGPPPGAETERP